MIKNFKEIKMNQEEMKKYNKLKEEIVSFNNYIENIGSEELNEIIRIKLLSLFVDDKTVEKTIKNPILKKGFMENVNEIQSTTTLNELIDIFNSNISIDGIVSLPSIDAMHIIIVSGILSTDFDISNNNIKIIKTNTELLDFDKLNEIESQILFNIEDDDNFDIEEIKKQNPILMAYNFNNKNIIDSVIDIPNSFNISTNSFTNKDNDHSYDWSNNKKITHNDIFLLVKGNEVKKIEETKEETKNEPKEETKEETKNEIKEETKEETKNEPKEVVKEEPKEETEEEVKEKLISSLTDKIEDTKIRDNMEEYIKALYAFKYKKVFIPKNSNLKDIKKLLSSLKLDIDDNMNIIEEDDHIRSFDEYIILIEKGLVNLRPLSLIIDNNNIFTKEYRKKTFNSLRVKCYTNRSTLNRK